MDTKSDPRFKIQDGAGSANNKDTKDAKSEVARKHKSLKKICPQIARRVAHGEIGEAGYTVKKSA